jgi:hypothetical protein
MARRAVTPAVRRRSKTELAVTSREGLPPFAVGGVRQEKGRWRGWVRVGQPPNTKTYEVHRTGTTWVLDGVELVPAVRFELERKASRRGAEPAG